MRGKMLYGRVYLEQAIVVFQIFAGGENVLLVHFVSGLVVDTRRIYAVIVRSVDTME